MATLVEHVVGPKQRVFHGYDSQLHSMNQSSTCIPEQGAVSYLLTRYEHEMFLNIDIFLSPAELHSDFQNFIAYFSALCKISIESQFEKFHCLLLSAM